MMRKVSPDPEKAKALRKMSEKILERVKETDEEKFPSQILRDYYDTIRQLMEAVASKNGMKSEGLGAHQQLIDWVIDEYGFSEKKRNFLHQVRKHRNRFEYEGHFVKKGYVERNESQFNEIIRELERILDEGL